MYLPKVYEKFINQFPEVFDNYNPRIIVTVAGVGYQYMADADNEI